MNAANELPIRENIVLLYCIVLYCVELNCIVLYCIVLYCIVLYCIVLYCIVLYCIVLYCIELGKMCRLSDNSNYRTHCLYRPLRRYNKD